MKQNNTTELLGNSFNEMYNKNVPPSPQTPTDPKSLLFPRFSRIFYGKSTFFSPCATFILIPCEIRPAQCQKAKNFAQSHGPRRHNHKRTQQQHDYKPKDDPKNLPSMPLIGEACVYSYVGIRMAGQSRGMGLQP